MRWSELTSRQFADLSRESVCVLPIGAIEQHGPHLPVATDYLIAMAIAERLDDACGGKLLVMPGVSVTCSAHHLAFPGTLSIEHNSFLNIVTQIVESAAKHGFRRFFLLNAHGGNMAIGGVVAEQLSAKLPACEVVFTTWFRAAGQQLRPLVEGEFPAVGHACEFETSIIMAIRPELVDHDAIADDGIAPKSELLHADLLSGGPAVLSLPFDKITKNGAWGKPTLASAEKGEAILNIVIPALKELLAAYWRDAPAIARGEKKVAGEAASLGAVVRNN
jgi:creatinine amidohydrolase